MHEIDANRCHVFISVAHQDVALNMAALFQKAFTDPLRFGQAADSEGGALMSPVDLATELVSGTDSCEELAHHAYAFFEASNLGVMSLLCQTRPVALARTTVNMAPLQPTAVQFQAITSGY